MNSNTNEKPEMPVYFYRRNSRGLTEAVETATGRVLCVQASHLDLLETKWERLVKIDTPQGPVWLEKGLNADLVPGLEGMPYSRVVADLVCQDITGGALLSTAGGKFGVTYADICRWKREQPEFKEALLQAKKDRAEYYHDEAVGTAKKSGKPYLQVETYKWAAEKGDPQGFGVEKGNQGALPTGPVVFQLVTNIIRPGDPGHEALAAARPVTELPEFAEKALAEIELPDFGGKEDG